MVSLTDVTTIEGIRCTYVPESPLGAVWELSISVPAFAQILLRCGRGERLTLHGPSGRQQALVRRFWVAPEGAALKVRLSLGALQEA